MSTFVYGDFTREVTLAEIKLQASSNADSEFKPVSGPVIELIPRRRNSLPTRILKVEFVSDGFIFLPEDENVSVLETN